MKILAFSDLHCDHRRAANLVTLSAEADLVLGAGDFASCHRGLKSTIAALAAIETPTVIVPGNNETESALRAAAAGWEAATVLQASSVTLDGVEIFGLGAGIPTTPWDWSFDIEEPEAARLLAACPNQALLVLHSPPFGHVDCSTAGAHLGSKAILEAIERTAPRLAVCGHIHESWHTKSMIGETPVYNLGPDGTWLEL